VLEVSARLAPVLERRFRQCAGYHFEVVREPLVAICKHTEVCDSLRVARPGPQRAWLELSTQRCQPFPRAAASALASSGSPTMSSSTDCSMAGGNEDAAG